jgi:adenine-specific DNA-methyltransferase
MKWRTLRKICDEVFGCNNFVANYIWEKKKKPSFLNANIGTKTEYIICYSKDRTLLGALSVDTTEEGKKYPFNNAGNSIANLTFPKGSVMFNMIDCVLEPQDMSEGNIITSLESELHIVDGTNENDFTLRGEWRYSQAKLDEIVANKERIVISKIPFRPNHIKQGGEVKKMHNLLSINNYQVGTNEDATAEQTKLLGNNYFDYAKPSALIQLLAKASTYSESDAIIMDFFSGSATTAEAVMQLNAEDNGHRKYICVQLPEVTPKDSPARKAGYDTIPEIGKERIRRAGKKIKEEHPDWNGDTGFRVLKLDSSNMENVYYTPAETTELTLFADNIKPDRTDEDLLFQVMMELGIALSDKIEKTVIAGKTVWNVGQGYLMACFERDVTEDTITAIAKQQPQYFVMADRSLASDNVADNFEQLFEEYSPSTIRKIL